MISPNSIKEDEMARFDISPERGDRKPFSLKSLFTRNAGMRSTGTEQTPGFRVEGIVADEIARYQEVFAGMRTWNLSGNQEAMLEKIVETAPEKMQKFQETARSCGTCNHSQMVWVKRAMDMALLPDLMYPCVDGQMDADAVCGYMRSLNGTPASPHPTLGRAQLAVTAASIKNRWFSHPSLVSMLNPSASMNHNLMFLAEELMKQHSWGGVYDGEMGSMFNPKKVQAYLELAAKIHFCAEDPAPVMEDELDQWLGAMYRNLDEDFPAGEDERHPWHSEKYTPEVRRLMRMLALRGPRFSDVYVAADDPLFSAAPENLNGLIRTPTGDAIPVVNGELILDLFCPGTSASWFSSCGTFRNFHIVDGKVNGCCTFLTPGNPMSYPVIGGTVITKLKLSEPFWEMDRVDLGDYTSCRDVTNVNGSVYAIINNLPFTGDRYVDAIDGRELDNFHDLHVVNGLLNGIGTVRGNERYTSRIVCDGHFLDTVDGQTTMGVWNFWNNDGHLYGIVGAENPDAKNDWERTDERLLFDGKLYKTILGHEFSVSELNENFMDNLTLRLNVKDLGQVALVLRGKPTLYLETYGEGGFKREEIELRLG